MDSLPFITTQQLKQTATTAGNFSNAFSAFCTGQCWYTIGDIVQVPLAQLLDHPGYIQQCHDELMDFLSAHHRLYLLDTTR